MGNGRVTGVGRIELGVCDLRRSAELYGKSWALYLGEEGERCEDIIACKLG